MNGITEGEALLVEDCGADTTLIVFAHRDAQNYAFRNVTANLGVNRILVRDPTLRGWYNQGLNGVGDNVAAIVDGLRERLNVLGSSRLMMLGSSMGAYAAILFGIKLHADGVLAFNPQTVLDPIFPLTPPPHFPCEIRDLTEVPMTCDTHIDLVIAEEDCADLYHAAHLSNRPQVQVRAVGGSTHLLTDELNEAGRLRPLIRDWLSGRDIPLAVLPFGKDVRRALLDGIPAFLRGEYWKCLGPLAIAQRAYPTHPGLPHLRGCALFEVGRYAEAVEAQEMALRRRPGWRNAMNELDRARERCPAGW